MIDNRFVSDPALASFAALADEYCTVVEEFGAVPAERLLATVHRLLASLYAAGLDLPLTGVLFSDHPDEGEGDTTTQVSDESDSADADRLTHAEWRSLFTGLTERIGEIGYYREVYDLYDDLENDPVIGSLADDIADIYRDLIAGLRKWKRGETGEALWEWRFGLEAHWGEHATSALRALHACTSTVIT